MLKRAKTLKTKAKSAKQGTKASAKKSARKRPSSVRVRTSGARSASDSSASDSSAGTLSTEGSLLVYRVRANAAAAKRQGAKAPFTITIRFLRGLSPAQQKAFTFAADRWTRVIVGDLPSVVIDGVRIDDVLIEAEGVAIDGPDNVLGQAAPTMLRPRNAGAAAFLPAKGMMSFDSADLAAMERDGTLNDVITHEMGHVLGIGTIWTSKRLLRGAGTANPTFVGVNAMKEFAALKGRTVAPTPVPVENRGGDGTRDSHWRETVFQQELMTGWVGAKPNPMSRLTVASLSDIGYKVDMTKADRFTLPDVAAMAEAGTLKVHNESPEHREMRPSRPIVLPNDALLR